MSPSRSTTDESSRSSVPEESRRSALADLQAACRACSRCVAEGLIPRAAPIFEGRAEARLFLVGQAPGPAELEIRRPFSGRAGRELARWMLRAGFASEDEFRRLTYVTSLMRCFPGRNAGGNGDRPPPARGVRCCSSWLDRELELLDPQVIILVGQLAIRRFLGPGALEDRVGRTFGERPTMLPLPHPSGQSRWLNDAGNRARLESALGRLAELRSRLSGPA